MMGFLVGLAVGIGAAPYVFAAVVLGLIVWLLDREFARQADEEHAERMAKLHAEQALAARAVEQHNLRMQGDPRGIYGVAAPAVAELQRRQYEASIKIVQP